MKDKIKFMEYMTLLGEVYNKEITDTLKNIYWKTLKLYSDKESIRAFQSIIENNKFFPKPAEFLDILRGDSGDQALLAWEKVYKAISQHGHYASVEFDEPVIHSCIELMGGWIELCSMELNDVKWKQKEFIGLYKTMSRKNQHPKYLAGQTELENGPRGFDVPDPVKIGGGEVKQITEGTAQ